MTCAHTALVRVKTVEMHESNNCPLFLGFFIQPFCPFSKFQLWFKPWKGTYIGWDQQTWSKEQNKGAFRNRLISSTSSSCRKYQPNRVGHPWSDDIQSSCRVDHLSFLIPCAYASSKNVVNTKNVLLRRSQLQCSSLQVSKAFFTLWHFFVATWVGSYERRTDQTIVLIIMAV